MTDLKTALWCDLTTDAERSAWLLLGRGYETGVVAKAMQNDLARAYQRLGTIMSGDHNQYQKPDNPLIDALERISTTSYIRDAHGIAIEALDHLAGKRKKVCKRCGEVNPAEIHTCTPLDPLLESGCGECGKKASDGWALYCVECSAPMREWIGLTDEEIRNSATQGRTDFSRPPYEEFYRAVEAKLRERNT